MTRRMMRGTDVAVVGAGIAGLSTAHALAERGASVVLAVRNVEKGEQAAVRITGDVTVQALDLSGGLIERRDEGTRRGGTGILTDGPRYLGDIPLMLPRARALFR